MTNVLTALNGVVTISAKGKVTGKIEAPSPIAGQAALAVDVSVGWCRLQASDNDKLTVQVQLGDSAPRVTQGYGGWEEVERPGRVSLTDWRGFKPIGVELELYLDRFIDGTSVEDLIDIIEALAGRGKKGTQGEPPLLIVNTAGVMPHDYHASPEQRWVINDLAYDDEGTIVNDAGNRCRCPLTLSLLQHVAGGRLADRALAARLKLQNRAGAARGTYTAKKGDTLVTIARKKLGDPGRWVELAQLNNIRDPRSIKPGAHIRLPK
jgi:nucleoid-associated protein YgaU